MKSTNARWPLLAGALILLSYTGAALFLPKGFGLVVFSDSIQCVLLGAAAWAFARNAIAASGRLRLFWALMSFSFALGTLNSYAWFHYEVIRGSEVPNPFIGDVVAFLFVVPMLCAVALRPHQTPGIQHRFEALDFLLVLLWWVYLYVVVVIPWQYVVMHEQLYGHAQLVLSVVQKSALLVTLGVMVLRTTGPWRAIYSQFLFATLLQTAASLTANAAINAGVYYTGSLYDAALIASMVWYLWIAVRFYHVQAPSIAAGKAEGRTWISALAMIAVLSIPFIAGWAYLSSEAPATIRDFRLLVTLAAMFLLTFMLFLKQHLLNSELLRSLRRSEETLEETRVLQSQLVHAEKLASLGKLVAGAAHELNNPLTAIIGYSDLLAEHKELTPGPRDLAGKIGQQARRTKSLVKNLLSFAQHSSYSPRKGLVDLNLLLTRAVRLVESNIHEQRIVFRREFPLGLPHVVANEDQLLEVALHILNNSIDAMERGSGVITVRTHQQGNDVFMEFEDDGTGIQEPARVFDPFYTTKPIGKGSGLGLSACFGIVKEHGGSITAANRESNGAVFTISLPVAAEGAARAVQPQAAFGSC